MPRAPNIRNLLIGRGSIYFDRHDSEGNPTGEYHHLGNCSQLETSFEDTKEEMTNWMSNTGGKYREITTERAGVVNITMTEHNARNLALITSGRTSSFAQTGATIAGEQLAAEAVDGATYFTAERGAFGSPLSAVTVDQGVTELVLGTDYEIDLIFGIVTLIEGGPNVTPGEALTIDYTSPAIAALDKVSMGADQIEGTLRFVGHPVVGPVYEVTLWKVQLSPEGTLAHISESFQESQLSGAILDDSVNHPSPDQYGVIQYTGEAR